MPMGEEYNNIPQLPESLRRDCLKRSQIVQFVNQQLHRIRTVDLHFPKILLNPNEKVRFIQILDGVLSDNERGNIALKLWTEYLCAAKECRRTCIAEHKPDGTTRRESPYTPHARAESFKKILITSNEDPIYEAGVQAAPVWELIENAAPDKKMYLDGISQFFLQRGVVRAYECH